MIHIGKIIETPVKVAFDDLDLGGVVYHANYLRIGERIRNDILEENGTSFNSLLATDTVLAVVNANLTYKRPLRMGTAYVYTELISAGKRSLVFGHAFRQTKSEIPGEGLKDIAKTGVYAEMTLVSASLKHSRSKDLPQALQFNEF